MPLFVSAIKYPIINIMKTVECSDFDDSFGGMSHGDRTTNSYTKHTYIQNQNQALL